MGVSRIGQTIIVATLMLFLGQSAIVLSISDSPTDGESFLNEPATTFTGGSGTVFTGNGTQWQTANAASFEMSYSTQYPISNDSFLFTHRTDADGNCFKLYSHSNLTAWNVSVDSNFDCGSSVPGLQYGPTIDNRVYISTKSHTLGTELFAFDITNSTLYLVEDINPTTSSFPVDLEAIGSTLYFQAEGSSTTGKELWAYNTTNSTSWLVADINPGAGDADPRYILPIGTSIVFVADDGTNGKELWTYETTNDSYWRVSDINPSGDGLYQLRSYGSAILGTRLMFWADDDGATGNELWAYETTNTTHWQVADINPGSGDSYSSAELITRDGSRMYFSADDGINGEELWAYESTNDSVWLLADICSGCDSTPNHIAVMGDQLIFTATHTTEGRELFIYNFSNNTAWMRGNIYQFTSGIADSGAEIIAVTGTQLLIVAKERKFSNPASDYGASLFVYETANDTLWWNGKLGLTTGGSSAQVMGGTLNLGTEVVFALSCSAQAGVACPNGDASGKTFWVYTPSNVTIPDDFTPSGGHVDEPPTGGFGGVWGGGSGDGSGSGSGEGISLSPASTTVSLTNNTAMTPITFNWTGGSGGVTTTYNGNGTAWLVADIRPSSSSTPEYLTPIGTRFYFSANDGTNGEELWAHETTNDSTWLAADIHPSSSSIPEYLTPIGTRLYFSANDGTNGEELWAHETTNDSTWLAANIRPSWRDSIPKYLTPIGTRLYFSANDGTNGEGLWAHETTNDSTWRVADIIIGDEKVVMGTRLYYAADDGNTGRELWAYETTNDSTWQVFDLNNGSSDGVGTGGIGALGTRLFFSGDNGTNGVELWAHETTNDSTWLVADILPSLPFTSSNPSNFAVIGTRLYFSAGYTGQGIGVELWAHETTNNTTWLVEDIDSGSDSSRIDDVVVIGTRLYFSASETWHPAALMAHETTNDSTWMTSYIGGSYGDPQYLIVMGTQIYFSADDGSDGRELWAYDPANLTITSSGPSNGPVTSAICEISPSLPTGISIAQGTCTISGTPTTTQSSTVYTLWVNDSGVSDTATIDITIESGDPFISPASTTVSLTNNTAMAPITFNFSWIGTGAQIPPDEPAMIKDINSGGDSSPLYLTVVGSTLYFVANDETNGSELWKSDGTASGTVMVKDINSGGSSSPNYLTVVSNILYFEADDGTNGKELWKSDGTASGTVMVKDIDSGGGSSLNYLTAVGNTLFFKANDGTNGSELWKSDGTASGTVMVKDIDSGGSSSLNHLTAVGNTLFFKANDGTNGSELWKSDGTASGTVMVKDISSA
ncbi:MAG TPA: hypothetical protein EYN88_00330, partial [Candidatus Poseidoniales archaeon]|nr:hypothetical protein [Candidatus Poseidoniales archaeon]